MSALKIKTSSGTWQEIPMIKGDKGDKGEQGDTYELTQQDKQDIADLVEVPEPLKYVKDDSSNNFSVIEGCVSGTDANEATGAYSHAEGLATKALGYASHSEGNGTQAKNSYSHAEGYNNISSADSAHSEGVGNTASGTASHAEGNGNVVSGLNSHVEGVSNTVTGSASHAEGANNEATNYASHVEGQNNRARGYYSHSEGYGNIASGTSSHAEGEDTEVISGANASHVEGKGTLAITSYQHAQGKYNNPSYDYVFMIGNGSSKSNRSNAMTVDWNGNGVYAGKLTVGTAPTNDMDVATKKYVDDVKGASIHICSSEEYDSTTRVPTIQNPDEKTFYLVPSEDGASPDLFVEWAYVNNAWEMFGSASIDLSNYVTNTDYATTNVGGIIRVGSGLKIGGDGQRLFTDTANSSDIKTGTQSYKPLSPYNQHEATFYGLAKASGDSTQSASSNAVGTYTDEAKASIQNMLGVPSVDDVVDDVQINGTSIVSNSVANIPVASNGAYGIMKVINHNYGLQLRDNGELSISNPTEAQLKEGAVSNRTLAPYKQHVSTFYGLAKAAGHDEKNSTLAFGNYTPEAKGAIQSMLGIDSLIAPTETNPFSEAHAIGDLFIINGALYKAKTAIAVGDVLDDGVNVDGVNVDDVVVKDVQINGTSILNDGVASIPIANNSVLGAVRSKVGDNGIQILSSGYLGTYVATDSDVKNGVHSYRPISPNRQHAATFYGLAKASGDTTQASSSNAVGTYTNEAKTAIKQMLGVVDSYDSLVVNVTGTDPVITAQPSYRYNCGEVASLTITPPPSGTIDFIFTSGTTPTVLDLPNTVKMPSWWTGVEANTTYEVCITDGVYCGVMSWDA